MFSFGVRSMQTSLAKHNAMTAARFICLVILILATASSVHSASKISNRSCITTEREGLLSFKAGITGDPDNLLTSWKQGHHDCCRWGGVTCSSLTGHVVKLDLRNRYLFEDKSFDLHSLHGQVSSSLLSLRSLRHLDLSGNTFLGDGMAMPAFLGSLQSLTYLNLSYMGFYGRVPPQLGNLSKLVQLDMKDNGLYSKDKYWLENHMKYAGLYSKDISWLARLRSLELLDISSVNLSGVIDWVHTVNALPNLVILILNSCGLNMINDPSPLLRHNLTVLEELDLSFNNFNSSAAPNWFWDVTSLYSLSLRYSGLSGRFPDELGNLTLLQTFDISFNNMNGIIPGTMQNMSNLRSLDLSFNNIGGDITEVIDRIPSCSWKNLKRLSLSDTNITSTTLQFLSNLTSISMLDVSRNGLSGSMPMEIGTLINLTLLDLGGNNLSGSMPIEIGMLINLTYLGLGHNNLNGSVPVEVGTLTKLTYLDLGNNNLSGVISEDHFASLMNLKYIELANNDLEFNIDSHWVTPFNLDIAFFSSCHLGPQFPKWLRWQKSISYLDISNTSLVGRIPDWFWTTFSDAVGLDMSLNQLSGELPLSLEFMSVSSFSMQSNLLTGLIPKLPRTVGLLDMSKNYLSGFPSSFQTPYLQVAILFSNYIAGSIPSSICQLQNLRILDLSNNLLSGELPDCGRKELKQQMTYRNNSPRVNSTSSLTLHLTTLLLSNNSLSSDFPLFLRQCPSIIFLDLAQNKFSGELPRWIGEAMPSLVMLRLRSNKFSGKIPFEITGLQVVRILDLSNNKFSGTIPQYLENLKALTGTTTSNNKVMDNPFDVGYDDYVSIGSYTGVSNDSFSVVIKGQVLQYRENTIYLMSLDLSCNSLTGEIPEAVSSLSGLVNLNLSSNLLSGNIPYNIGNLRSLESLDLSKNKLGGEIPQGLSDLTYLSYLNLSYNNLSGRIPLGGQLDILKADDPASVYIGNPGLCGHPVPRQCPCPPGDLPGNGDSARWSEDGLFQMDIFLGLIVGFVAGTWMVFCGLLFMKRWRYAYFGLLDRLYDRFYVISIVTWRKWFGNTSGN